MNAEGRNAVAEAIRSDKTVDRVIVENGLRDEQSRALLAEIKESGVKFSFADKAVLDKMSSTKKHQGFIAVLSEFTYSELEDIIADCKKTGRPVVVLDGVEDPHNLGSIIRVCECGGVSGIVIGKHRQAPVSDTVLRISEGSAAHVKIAKVTNVNNAIKTIKAENIFVFSLELGGEDIYKTDLTGAVAIVVGGEDTGVNALTKKLSDGVVTIPMCGKINSLNASVAAGIAVFEALRQRRNKL
ncbi:MAG: 23S rRNA (guanosine(2251)-2'-O)-methyltransferase RlmB [Clostridia bacterium]|nr:23S rRNA (guanosine(2251)-2'-O)-methyltransferase RlmB [Clostridia bacterium]